MPAFPWVSSRNDLLKVGPLGDELVQLDAGGERGPADRRGVRPGHVQRAGAVGVDHGAGLGQLGGERLGLRAYAPGPGRRPSCRR